MASDAQKKIHSLLYAEFTQANAEAERLLKDTQALTNERITLSRELADAKATIERYRAAFGELPSTPENQWVTFAPVNMQAAPPMPMPAGAPVMPTPKSRRPPYLLVDGEYAILAAHSGLTLVYVSGHVRNSIWTNLQAQKGGVFADTVDETLFGK